MGSHQVFVFRSNGYFKYKFGKPDDNVNNAVGGPLILSFPRHINAFTLLGTIS